MAIEGIKIISGASNTLFYTIVVFMDIFWWGISGMLSYALSNGIESWAVAESLSFAWKGMFQPLPFVIGHGIGIIFYLCARAIWKNPKSKEVFG